MLKRADEVVTENYRKIEKALKGATEAKRASMIQEFSLDKICALKTATHPTTNKFPGDFATACRS